MPSRTAPRRPVPAAVIVVAAGSGSRAGLGIPKQFLRVAGRTLLEHSVARLRRHARIGTIVAVVPRERVGTLRRSLAGADVVVPGGARRQDSVRRGLAALEAVRSGIVLVHDAARPLVPPAVIDAVIASASRHGSGVPALPPQDSVREIGPRGGRSRGLARDRVRLVQTPQGFRISWLRKGYEVAARRGLAATDDAALVEAAGYPIRVVEGSPLGFKVTTPEDVRRVRALLEG